MNTLKSPLLWWGAGLVVLAYAVLVLRLLGQGYLRRPVNRAGTAVFFAALLTLVWGALGLMALRSPVWWSTAALADIARYGAWLAFFACLFRGAQGRESVDAGGWLVLLAVGLPVFSAITLLFAVVGARGEGQSSTLIFLALVGLVAFGLSGSFRAWLRVLGKHFFRYRHDHREEPMRFMQRTGWVVNLDECQHAPERCDQVVLPDWLKGQPQAWLLVPLWLGQELLGFVVHDLKNIVTQFSLMVKNAKRLGHNPEFQADTLMTAENSPLAAGATRCGRMLDLRPGERVAARGHVQRLEQVIGHLVNNAFDATEPGQSVWIQRERFGSFVRVGVGDDGVGMSAEFVQNRLFKPFQTTKAAGMGIGAHESFQYVQELGGMVQVDSQAGRGTVVGLLLLLMESFQPSDLHTLEET